MGGEVGDGGESGVADAVGAAPVPGGGGVGVVDGDGGGAGLAAADDVDAADQAVFGGVEVLVADDGFDVIQDGDGHDGCLSCVTLKASGPGVGQGVGGDAAVVGICGAVPGHGVVGDGDHPVADRAEGADGRVVAAERPMVVVGR